MITKVYHNFKKKLIQNLKKRKIYYNVSFFEECFNNQGASNIIQYNLDEHLSGF